jgi:hypothetical protein
MVGSGALRECLLDPTVEHVLAVGRSTTGQWHETLRELVGMDLTDYASVADALSGVAVAVAVAPVTTCWHAKRPPRRQVASGHVALRRLLSRRAGKPTSRNAAREL